MNSTAPLMNLGDLLQNGIMIQLSVGIFTSIFGTIIICFASNKITQFFEKLLDKHRTLLILLHLSIIFILLIILRILLNYFVTNQDVFQVIFCIVGPTLFLSSNYFKPYLKKVIHFLKLHLHIHQF